MDVIDEPGITKGLRPYAIIVERGDSLVSLLFSVMLFGMAIWTFVCRESLIEANRKRGQWSMIDLFRRGEQGKRGFHSRPLSERSARIGIWTTIVVSVAMGVWLQVATYSG